MAKDEGVAGLAASDAPLHPGGCCITHYMILLMLLLPLSPLHHYHHPLNSTIEVDVSYCTTVEGESVVGLAVGDVPLPLSGCCVTRRIMPLMLPLPL